MSTAAPPKDSEVMTSSDEAKLESMLARYAEGGRAAAPAANPPAAVNAKAAEVKQVERLEAQKLLVAQILKEKGERGIGDALRSEIAKCKKLDSDIAAARKKVENAKKDHEKLQTELAHMAKNKGVLEAQCQHYMEQTQNLAEGFEKRKAEDEANRAEISDRITGEIAKLEAKLEEDAQAHQKVVEENGPLREKFDAQKAEFDAQFQKYEADWKLRETQMKLVVERANAQITKNDELQSKWTMNQRELLETQQAILGMREQLSLFESKLPEFEETTVKTEDMMSLGAAYKKQIQERLDMLEKEKQTFVDGKKQHDAEATKVRAKIRQLKGKVQAAERAKTQAEAKCREAQAAALKAKAAAEKENRVSTK